ncbi:hypothetical protein NL676_012232 [Syzygium grande]|nr:hypothetical protein NL676_012232 [Syzygium grande]
MVRPSPLFGIPTQIHCTLRVYPSGNGKTYVRYHYVIFVNVGEYFYQTQEYVAWCLKDTDGNIMRPLRTFDVPVDIGGVMIPQMVGSEIVDPLIAKEPVAMNQEPKDPNEDGEVTELGSDVEVGSDEELGLYLDPELEMDSEDEQSAA